jgi:hypothetical protein
MELAVLAAIGLFMVLRAEWMVRTRAKDLNQQDMDESRIRQATLVLRLIGAIALGLSTWGLLDILR